MESKYNISKTNISLYNITHSIYILTLSSPNFQALITNISLMITTYPLFFENLHTLSLYRFCILYIATPKTK